MEKAAAGGDFIYLPAPTGPDDESSRIQDTKDTGLKPGIRAGKTKTWLWRSIEYEGPNKQKYLMNRNSAVQYLERHNVKDIHWYTSGKTILKKIHALLQAHGALTPVVSRVSQAAEVTAVTKPPQGSTPPQTHTETPPRSASPQNSIVPTPAAVSSVSVMPAFIGNIEDEDDYYDGLPPDQDSDDELEEQQTPIQSISTPIAGNVPAPASAAVANVAVETPASPPVADTPIQALGKKIAQLEELRKQIEGLCDHLLLPDLTPLMRNFVFPTLPRFTDTEADLEYLQDKNDPDFESIFATKQSEVDKAIASAQEKLTEFSNEKALIYARLKTEDYRDAMLRCLNDSYLKFEPTRQMVFDEVLNRGKAEWTPKQRWEFLGQVVESGEPKVALQFGSQWELGPLREGELYARVAEKCIFLGYDWDAEPYFKKAAAFGYKPEQLDTGMLKVQLVRERREGDLYHRDGYAKFLSTMEKAIEASGDDRKALLVQAYNEKAEAAKKRRQPLLAFQALQEMAKHRGQPLSEEEVWSFVVESYEKTHHLIVGEENERLHNEIRGILETLPIRQQDVVMKLAEESANGSGNQAHYDRLVLLMGCAKRLGRAWDLSKDVMREVYLKNVPLLHDWKAYATEESFIVLAIECGYQPDDPLWRAKLNTLEVEREFEAGRNSLAESKLSAALDRAGDNIDKTVEMLAAVVPKDRGVMRNIMDELDTDERHWLHQTVPNRRKNISRVYAKAAEQAEPNEAVSLLDFCVKVNPSNFAHREQLFKACIAAKKFDAAARVLRDWKKIKPDVDLSTHLQSLNDASGQHHQLD